MQIEKEIVDILQKIGFPLPKESQIDYLRRFGDSEISYIPKGKIPLFEAECAKTKFGYREESFKEIMREFMHYFHTHSDIEEKQIKILSKFEVVSRCGKAIKKFIPDMGDKRVEDFVSRFVRIPAHFEIWEDVGKAYKVTPKSGVHSCMTSDSYTGEKRYNMDFYSKNGVKSLVLLEDKRLIGRALLWEGVEFEVLGKQTMMDRVYVLDSKNVIKFNEYAKNNKWVRRNGDVEFVFNNYPVKRYKAFYPMKTIDVTFWPYMDTMYYIGRDNKDSPYKLCNVNNGVGVNSNNHNCPLPLMIYSKYEAKEIDKREATLSEVGWISRRNAQEINGKIYHKNQTHSCEVCSNIYLKEDMYKLQKGWGCKKCVVETADSIERKSDCVYTYNKKWIRKEDAVLIDYGFSATGSLINLKWGDKNDPFIVKQGESFVELKEKIDHTGDDQKETPIPDETKTKHFSTGYFIDIYTGSFKW